MSSLPLTSALTSEYANLFATSVISPSNQKSVDDMIDHIVANQSRYQAVGSPLGIPWFFIGTVHSLEASLNFNCHLHNGDPLTARTVQVPAGRPLTGSPTFTWEASATDALTMHGLDKVTDWSVPSALYRLEAYNGFGYRLNHPQVLTPYLWSKSNHYTSGKYVKDGVFNPDAVSSQIGGAVILHRMAERQLIQFSLNSGAATATAAT